MLGGLTVLIVAGALGFLGWSKMTHVELDAATLCPGFGPRPPFMPFFSIGRIQSPRCQAQRLGQIVDKVVDGGGGGRAH